MVDEALTAVLGAWFLASVWNQARSESLGRVHNLDVGSLIPNWCFFAPRPGTVDLSLVYRDRPLDGEWGPWRVVHPGPSARHRMLWNPRKRPQKVAVDLIQQLFQLAESVRDPRRLAISLPYVWLLTLVESQERDFTADERQFAIVADAEHDPSVELDVLVASVAVSLPPDSRAPQRL